MSLLSPSVLDSPVPRYLLAFDCVSFNRFLETILTSNSVNPFTGAQKVHQSPWLFTTAADTIFSVARERVYRQKKIGISVKQKPVEGNSGSSTAEKLRGKKPVEQAEEEIPDDLAEDDFDQIDEQVLREMENFNAPTPLTAEESRIKQEEKERLRGLPPGVEPVLEEQPKWKLLSEVLEEIETELYFHEPQEGTSRPSSRSCTDSPSRRSSEQHNPRHVLLCLHLLHPPRVYCLAA